MSLFLSSLEMSSSLRLAITLNIDGFEERETASAAGCLEQLGSRHVKHLWEPGRCAGRETARLYPAHPQVDERRIAWTALNTVARSAERMPGADDRVVSVDNLEHVNVTGTACHRRLEDANVPLLGRQRERQKRRGALLQQL